MRLGGAVTLELAALELEQRLGHFDAALARVDRLRGRAGRPEGWTARRGDVLELAGHVGDARAHWRLALEELSRLPTHVRRTRTSLQLAGGLRERLLRTAGLEGERLRPATALGLPLLCALLTGHGRGQDLLVASGSTWSFLDDGSDQGGAWTAPGFDDSGWSTGPAQLGYGDGDEATVVGFGPDPGNKYVTTYFRHAFDVTDPSLYVALRLEVLRDDGFVAFLNRGRARARRPRRRTGRVEPVRPLPHRRTERGPLLRLLGRSRVPGLRSERARGGGAPERTGQLGPLPRPGALGRDGTGRHARPVPPARYRSGSHGRWRTNAATDSVVRFGSSPTTLMQSALVAGARTEHEVALSGLAPGTLSTIQWGRAEGHWQAETTSTSSSPPHPRARPSRLGFGSWATAAPPTRMRSPCATPSTPSTVGRGPTWS